jgi:Tol biopolymer transport system component
LVRYDAARAEFVPYLPGTSARWISSSKDGRWIAYTTSAPETLWRSRPDGSEAVQLTPRTMRVYSPQWSPDGAWIAFNGFPAKQTYGVYVVPSAGGVPQRISAANSADSGGTWSPDGRSLLFHHSPPPGVTGWQGVCVLDWKTRKLTPLPGAEQYYRGSWSPDGRRIAATDGTHIQILDTRTGRWTPLVTGKGIGVTFWSRDARYIIYQEGLEADQPISRVPAGGGKVERLMSSKQIPQSDFSAYSLVNLASDDAPIASLIRNNSDIYSLELDLP